MSEPDCPQHADPSPRSVTIPAGVVPHFEAALRRRDVAATVSFHDDGSRTYHVAAADWDEAAIIRAAEQALDDLRATLRNAAA